VSNLEAKCYNIRDGGGEDVKSIFANALFS